MARRYRYYRFEARLNEEYGSVGLVQPGRRNFDPLGALVVPNDILEHFPDARGTIDDEMRELGASLWVSGTFGNATPAEAISSEFLDLFAKCNANQGHLSTPVGVRHLEEDWVEGQLHAMHEHGLKLLRSGHFQDVNSEELSDWILAAADHMRVGYRRALRRYAKVSQVFVQNSFANLEADAEKALRQISEGDTVVFMLHLRSACTDFKVVPYSDYG